MRETTATAGSIPKRNILVRLLTFLKRRNTIVEFICALFIILFIYTGLNKLMDIGKFKYEMERSPFIQNMAGFIAYALPIYEILLSLFLIIKRTRILGLYLSFALMSLFTGYIWLMLNYAYDLPCSCGGIISELSWNEHLILNAVFSGFAVIGVVIWNRLIAEKKQNYPQNLSTKKL